MTEQGASPNPAQAYQDHLVPAMFQPWAEELLRRIVPKPGDCVLDVACGTGAVTRMVATLVGQHGSVMGLDISRPMLDVARSLPPPGGACIAWLEGSADDLSFESDRFDVVVCQQGLQFVPDRVAAVREMHRVLKPGGKAGVSVWRALEHQSLLATLSDAMDRQFGATANDPFSMGDAGELHAMFEQAGFRDVTIEAVRRAVRFPSAEQFVQLVVLGASAVIPELAEASDADRAAAIDAIRQDIDGQLQAARAGDGIAFSMESHIITAHRSPRTTPGAAEPRATCHVRPAEPTPADASAFAQLANMASGGIVAGLLGSNFKQSLGSMFLRHDNLYSYRQVQFVEVEHEIVAMICTYSGQQHASLHEETFRQFLAFPGVDAELAVQLEPILEFIDTVPIDAYYVVFLAVYPQARGNGYAKHLLAVANDLARQHGAKSLELDVVTDNEVAINAYLGDGLHVSHTSPRVSFDEEHGEVALHRMVKAIA